MKKEKYYPLLSSSNVFSFLLSITIPLQFIAGVSSMPKKTYLVYFYLYFSLLVSYFVTFIFLKKYSKNKAFQYLVPFIPVNIFSIVAFSELLLLGFIDKGELSINLKLFALFQVVSILLLRFFSPKSFTVRHF